MTSEIKLTIAIKTRVNITYLNPTNQNNSAKIREAINNILNHFLPPFSSSLANQARINPAGIARTSRIISGIIIYSKKKSSSKAS